MEEVYDEIISKLRGKFSKVYVFGSRARGDALRNSDLDVIVVDEQFRSMPYVERVRAVREAISDIMETSPIDIDIIPLTREEFNQLSKARTNIVGLAAQNGELVEA